MITIPWKWFTAFWALLIFVLSVIPGEDLPSVSIWEADKLAHGFVYMVLGFSLVKLLNQQFNTEVRRWKNSFLAIFLCILFGLCIEVIQGELLASRTFDVYDLLANTIGCLLGVTGIIFIFKPY